MELGTRANLLSTILLTDDVIAIENLDEKRKNVIKSDLYGCNK